MWEGKYDREPVDYRLLWLRFLGKIWIVPLAALLGAALVGMVYYYSRTAARGGRTYQAESVFYIDFAPLAEGVEHDYYNFYTWGEVIHSDFFMDGLFQKMDGALTREELVSYVTATVESDPRYLYVRCNTHSPELSVRLARAMEELVPEFPKMREELARIEIATAAHGAADSSKIRLGNACFLGVCVGLAVSVFGILIALTADLSVYLPSTPEKRYHIPCLGAAFLPELAPNCAHFFKGCGDVAVVSVDADLKEEDLRLPDVEGARYVLCKNPVEDPEELTKIRSCQKTVLALKAGVKNDKIFERLIEQLGRQNIAVTAVFLARADQKLLACYYRSKL